MIATSTAPIFAFSALSLTMVIFFVYIAIFFFILYLCGWMILLLFRPIMQLMKYKPRRYDY